MFQPMVTSERFCVMSDALLLGIRRTAPQLETLFTGGRFVDKMAAIPSLPPQFKPIQHYLKTATEHDKRDPVVAYYCEFLLT